MKDIIQKARDAGAKFEQRHESFSYSPGYWYSNHAAGELHETKEAAAAEYLELIRKNNKAAA